MKSIAALLLIAAFASLTSCIPLAVGAAAGYVAHDQGYRVQSPVKKTDDGSTDEDYDRNY